MGATKTDHFTAEQNEIARLAKALGHPARVAIVQHLIRANSCICTDVVNELPLAQPTVSQHLRELKDAGLIRGNISGNSICYGIDYDRLHKLHFFIEKLRNNRPNGGKIC